MKLKYYNVYINHDPVVTLTYFMTRSTLVAYRKIAAHSAYEMFSWYKCLVVKLVFSHLGFWSGSLFLIAPFPDLCLLVLF